MPITEASLAGKIVDEIVSAKGVPADPSRLQEFASAVARAIVSELTENAVITGTVTGGGSSSGSAITGEIT